MRCEDVNKQFGSGSDVQKQILDKSKTLKCMNSDLVQDLAGSKSERLCTTARKAQPEMSRKLLSAETVHIFWIALDGSDIYWALQ